MVIAPLPSILGARDSSLIQCSWCSFNSAASSIVTIRSPSGINSERILSMVVFPLPVPPETIIFFLDTTQAFINSAIAEFIVFMPIKSGILNLSFLNFLMVRVGPVKERGGIMALTREPSGRRASTIGTDSSIRLPIGAMIRSMIVLTCSLATNFLLVSSILPFFSMYISSLLFTMMSVMPGSSNKSSSGPSPKASSRISLTNFLRTSSEEMKLPASSVRKFETIVSALSLNSLVFLASLNTFKSSLFRFNSSISRLLMRRFKTRISSASSTATGSIKDSAIPCFCQKSPGLSTTNSLTLNWSISVFSTNIFSPVIKSWANFCIAMAVLDLGLSITTGTPRFNARPTAFPSEGI